MTPFWSFLESCATFLNVQLHPFRFGSVMWLVYVFFCSFQQTLVGEEEEGEATCGTASLQSNCPNQDRSQVTCLFPSRVSVSRTIKPILETGCCAKQRPPDFFSQKVILFCVTGDTWYSWKTLFLWITCVLSWFYRVQEHHVSIIVWCKSSIILKGWLEWSPNWLLIDL